MVTKRKGPGIYLETDTGPKIPIILTEDTGEERRFPPVTPAEDLLAIMDVDYTEYRLLSVYPDTVDRHFRMRRMETQEGSVPLGERLEYTLGSLYELRCWNWRCTSSRKNSASPAVNAAGIISFRKRRRRLAIATGSLMVRPVSGRERT